MAQYTKSIWQSRVNTWLGCALIAVWSSACGLMMWNASFDQNPVANAFSALARQEAEL